MALPQSTQQCRPELRKKHEVLVSPSTDNDQICLPIYLFQGPAHGRPMPLLLPAGGEVESGNVTGNMGDGTIQQRKANSGVKGKALGRSECLLTKRICICCHKPTCENFQPRLSTQAVVTTPMFSRMLTMPFPLSMALLWTTTMSRLTNR